MLYRFILLILSVEMLCSCISRNKPAQSVDEKPNPHQKPQASFNDTLRVDYAAAVFYQPDSLQNEKIKAVTDPSIFESLEHDCYFQARYSKIALQQHWPAIRIVEAKNCRYILFVASENNTIECIDLDKVADACGVYLFDTHKKPKLADMTNIDSELGFYF